MMTKLRLFLREYWPYILAAFLVTWFLARPVHAQVQLPIEVYAPDGRSAAVETITVDVGLNPSSLCFRSHQAGRHMGELMYQNGWDYRDDAASVSVGNSPFVGDWNSTASYVESAITDGIGGGFHTQWVCIPASAFAGQLFEGTRQISFRFNETEGIRSGYRIIDLDVRSGGTTPETGTSVLNTQLQLTDPTTWGIPAGGNVTNGRVIFTSRPLQDIDGTPLDVHISCASCHASDGYDLSYFGYSDKVIGARARAHIPTLTEQEVTDVVAYIRSIDAENEYARPWNPVFQPGPAVRQRSAEYWSAGAGVDAVLRSDDDMAQYMFPDQSPEGMRTVLDHGSWDNWPLVGAPIIDVQEIPISIQYPDWNAWLPDVHPFTAYGYGDFTAHSSWNALQELETAYDTPQAVQETINRDRAALVCTQSCPAGGFTDLLRFNFGFGGELMPYLDIDWDVTPATHYLALQSLMQFYNVKMWGELQTNNLFDLAERITDGLVTPAGWRGEGMPILLAGSPPGDQDPAFFWPGHANTVYGTAPHINSRCSMPQCGDGGYDNVGPVGPPGARFIEGYMSAVWYDVQNVISSENIGWPGNNGGGPTDWNYVTDHNSGIMGHRPGYSQFWRLFSRRILASQSRNNYYTQATTHYQYAFNSGPGFTATNANYWEPVGRAANGVPHYRYASNQTLAISALEAYWNEWAEFARSVPNDWWVREPEPSGMYEVSSTVPTTHVPGNYFFDAYQDAQNAYNLADLMTDLNMDSTAVDNVARWGESMWPGGNFEQWFVNAPPPPPPGNQPPVVQITFPTEGSTVGKRYTIRANVTDPDNNVTSVNFFVRTPRDTDFVLACSDGVPPYECLRTVNKNNDGPTTARVQAVDFVGATDMEEVHYTTSLARNITAGTATFKLDALSTGAVYDILGRRVISFQDADEIVIRGLSAGTYMLVTEDGTQFITIR